MQRAHTPVRVHCVQLKRAFQYLVTGITSGAAWHWCEDGDGPSKGTRVFDGGGVLEKSPYL